jgi:DNA-binding NtrC family response regulator
MILGCCKARLHLEDGFPARRPGIDRMNSTVSTENFIEVTGGTLVALSSETGEPVGEPVRIGPESCIVGRGNHCQLILDDPHVSSSHCEVTATDKGVRVRDLDSTNGTFLHQARLDKGAYLPSSARLRCGQTWLSVRVTSRETVPLAKARFFGPIVGGSAAMRRIYARLASVAPHDLSVLVTGETGTGKELVAEAIHKASRRESGPFIVIDCTTIPAALAESRLFGHEKGSFTGAVSRQISPFIEATGGTLFFDELGELPLEVQPKLLRALEARQIQSLGSNRYQPIDVRIVAATRRNMHEEINAKRFRDDLYHRFAQVIIHVPPLRERTEDIPYLLARFLADVGDPDAIARIDQPSLDRLLRHDWTGNVRELRNVILTAHAVSNGGPMEVTDFLDRRRGLGEIMLADRASSTRSFSARKSEVLEVFEREFFGELHRNARGNVSEMARVSGLSRPTVRQYLARYGLRFSE